jgi:hypothetical protein
MMHRVRGERSGDEDRVEESSTADEQYWWAGFVKEPCQWATGHNNYVWRFFKSLIIIFH